jgi:protease secretion system membrane fusion protein
MKTDNASQALPEPSAPDDVVRVARRGLWALGVGLGGFFLWAAFAPLDEGVPSPAVVVIETQRKTVQHLSGGIVKEVRVREGQTVKAGEVLFRLDEAAARANHESVRQRYLGLRAVQARLNAEQLGRPTLSLHADLQAALEKDPLIRTQVQTQQALLSTRAQGLQAELRGIEESIMGQRAVIESTALMQGNRQTQLKLLQEELRNTSELVNEGYAPRNRQFELERFVADGQASLSDLRGRHEQATRAVAELMHRSHRARHVFFQEVQTQLGSVTLEVQSDADKLQALANELGRIEIVAPVGGQVVGLMIQTVGGVIQPGQKLLDIVPESEPLVLEVRIAPHLIDKVRENLITDVRFSAFAHTPQLVVEGKVLSVSQDLLTDSNSGMSYYLARVELTSNGMRTLHGRRLQAGMPAEVVIKTGERSLLTYLLHPLTKRLAASLKEE